MAFRMCYNSSFLPYNEVKIKWQNGGFVHSLSDSLTAHLLALLGSVVKL